MKTTFRYYIWIDNKPYGYFLENEEHIAKCFMENEIEDGHKVAMIRRKCIVDDDGIIIRFAE